MHPELTHAIKYGDYREIRRRLYRASVVPPGKPAGDWAAEAAKAIIAIRGPFGDLTGLTCVECDGGREFTDDTRFCHKVKRFCVARSVACVKIERKS